MTGDARIEQVPSVKLDAQWNPLLTEPPMRVGTGIDIQ
jgi:hypothetical protein